MLASAQGLKVKSGNPGPFLDAPSHLYKRSCPSVGPSVRSSVGPSVPCYFRRWSVRILGVSCAVYPALFLPRPSLPAMPIKKVKIGKVVYTCPRSRLCIRARLWILRAWQANPFHPLPQYLPPSQGNNDQEKKHNFRCRELGPWLTTGRRS